MKLMKKTSLGMRLIFVVLIGILAITNCTKKKNAVLWPLALLGGNIATASNALTSGTYPTSDPVSVQVGQQLTLSPSQPVTGATYTVSPTLPAGLSLNASTGIISGTPTGESPATSYTITQTRPDGTKTSWVVVIGVAAGTSVATGTGTGTGTGGGNTSVATPTFSPAAGFYATAQNVSIASTTSGANIYYTTDGTAPTSSSTLYSTAVHIWSLAGKTIKAYATKSGLADSSVLSGIFSYPPLQSGQTTVYAAGDNGTNQSGVARGYTGPTAHVTYTSDYTTTDTATGLVWKTCTQGLSGATCATGAAVTLTWDNASADATNGCTALNSANSGNGYAGRKTWRLPSRQELETLPDYSRSSPAINVTAFPATVAYDYWSSSTYAPNTSYAWVVHFSDGAVGYNSKTNSFYVRCVSGP